MVPVFRLKMIVVILIRTDTSHMSRQISILKSIFDLVASVLMPHLSPVKLLLANSCRLGTGRGTGPLAYHAFIM